VLLDCLKLPDKVFDPVLLLLRLFVLSFTTLSQLGDLLILKFDSLLEAVDFVEVGRVDFYTLRLELLV
jgi:hypothetical protein